MDTAGACSPFPWHLFYTKDELRKLIEEDGLFGPNGKIVSIYYKQGRTGNNHPVYVTISWPDYKDYKCCFGTSYFFDMMLFHRNSVMYQAKRIKRHKSGGFGDAVLMYR